MEYITRVGPCHYGMARPQDTGGGDGLQIRTVATNKLKSHWGQPTICGHTPGGVEGWAGGLTTLHTILAYYEMLQRASNLGGFFSMGLDSSGPVAGSCEQVTYLRVP
jgi:hypothetical protein